MENELDFTVGPLKQGHLEENYPIKTQTESSGLVASRDSKWPSVYCENKHF